MSKLLGALAICLAAATAHADPEFGVRAPPPMPLGPTARGVWLDVGDSYGHVIALGDRLRTQSLYVAPHILLSRLVYAGLEIAGGTLAGTGLLPTDGFGPENPMPQTAGPLGGDVVSIRGITGARAFLGPVSGGAEVVVGVQYAVVSNQGAVVGADSTRSLCGLRGRIDFWARPWFTVGTTAGIDLLEPGGFAVGVGIGLHAVPYDGARR